VKVLEVTLRTPVALRCIEAIARAVPDAIVGAGTLRSGGRCRGRARRRQRASASAPATPPRWAMPAAAGPAAAARRGHRQRGDGRQRRRADFLKFFPATAAGGVPMLKALGGPFPDVVFCPTGGITPRRRRSSWRCPT
jgi:2-dehydro-3-deoxyphosphogluconate aldolase/(4S)-4-hydroxy-2-oxoglutarate aldolase